MNCLCGCRVDSQDIVAVNLDTRHSVGQGFLGQGFGVGLLGQRDGYCPLVILADEDHWNLINSSAVHPFMEVALRGSAVAKKGHDNLVGLAVLSSPAKADCMNYLGGHRHRHGQIFLIFRNNGAFVVAVIVKQDTFHRPAPHDFRSSLPKGGCQPVTVSEQGYSPDL